MRIALFLLLAVCPAARAAYQCDYKVNCATLSRQLGVERPSRAKYVELREQGEREAQLALDTDAMSCAKLATEKAAMENQFLGLERGWRELPQMVLDMFRKKIEDPSANITSQKDLVNAPQKLPNRSPDGKVHGPPLSLPRQVIENFQSETIPAPADKEDCDLLKKESCEMREILEIGFVDTLGKITELEKEQRKKRCAGARPTAEAFWQRFLREAMR